MCEWHMGGWMVHGWMEHRWMAHGWMARGWMLHGWMALGWIAHGWQDGGKLVGSWRVCYLENCQHGLAHVVKAGDAPLRSFPVLPVVVMVRRRGVVI